MKIVKKLLRKEKKARPFTSGSSTGDYRPDRDPEESLRTLLLRAGSDIERNLYLALLETLDFEAYREIQRNSRRAQWRKYLDLQRCLPGKVKRAIGLELHTKPPMRILDIGSGAGHFGLVCRHLGHEYTGINVPDSMYEAVNALFGLRLVQEAVEPLTPLPLPDERFDMITAFAANFHVKKMADGYALYSEEDWEYFIKDAQSRLESSESVVYLGLNKAFRNLPTYTPEFVAAMERMGGIVDLQRHFVRFG